MVRRTVESRKLIANECRAGGTRREGWASGANRLSSWDTKPATLFGWPPNGARLRGCTQPNSD